MPFVPTASGVVPPAGWFPDIGRPEILPRQTTAAIPAIIFNTTGFFFFFKEFISPLLVILASLVFHTGRARESFGDRSIDESPASTEFMDRFIPTRNRTSSSTPRIEQRTTEPFYALNSTVSQILL